MRSLLGRLLLVIGSVLATLLAVDLVLLAWHGPVRSVESFYEPDARFGYRMRPHQDFVFASPYHGYRARVRTNSLGLRAPEIAVPKPAGTFRILLLGDSMTAGLEVEADDTCAAVAEALLAPSGPVEVINAGVRGYNLDNILGFLRSVGLACQPDVVVYLFVDNDLTSETAYRPETGDVSRGFTPKGLVGRLATYSHIAYRLEIVREMLVMRWQRDRAARQSDKAYVHRGLLELFTDHDYDTNSDYQQTAARIAALAAMCRQNGATFLLATPTHREEIDPAVQARWSSLLGARGAALDFDGARRYLAWAAARHALPLLDAVPAFRRDLGRDRDYWFHEDNHLNARGHRLLGALLAERIETLPPFQEWRARRTSLPAGAAPKK